MALKLSYAGAIYDVWIILTVFFTYMVCSYFETLYCGKCDVKDV